MKPDHSLNQVQFGEELKMPGQLSLQCILDSLENQPNFKTLVGYIAHTVEKKHSIVVLLVGTD